MTKQTARRIRIAGWVMFLVYLILLGYSLFFSESYGRTAGLGEYHYNLVPFREISRYLKYPDILGTYAVMTNLVGNIIGFLPFGAILPVLSRRARNMKIILLSGFLFSSMVEMIQLVTRVGSCDVDDVILNTTGAAAGYLIFRLCDRFRRKIYG